MLMPNVIYSDVTLTKPGGLLSGIRRSFPAENFVSSRMIVHLYPSNRTCPIQVSEPESEVNLPWPKKSPNPNRIVPLWYS
ncbi:hypothetical protein TNCV_1157431 [Trichonephila clavipes]|nr:hypothetical protein TNCV_1157431 [Trichonephila clavipes]